MAQGDIRGQVVDASGNPVSGAIVELTKSYQSSPTDEEAVRRTTTDSNGNYVFYGHPDGDGTTQEWHVAAYNYDGSAYVNSFNNPGVTADLTQSLIPDSVVDNFELDSADPPGVYASGETLADYYSGATGNWSLTTSSPLVGGRSVTWDEGQTAIWSNDGDGLNRYPTETDNLSVLLRRVDMSNSESTTVQGTLTNVEDVTSPQAYVFDISDERGIRIGIASYNSDGTRSSYTNFDSTAASLSVNTTYYGEIDPPTSGDNSITFDVYNWSGSVGSLIGSASTTDSQLVGSTGVGWAQQRILGGTTAAADNSPVGDQMEIL